MVSIKAICNNKGSPTAVHNASETLLYFLSKNKVQLFFMEGRINASGWWLISQRTTFLLLGTVMKTTCWQRRIIVKDCCRSELPPLLLLLLAHDMCININV